MTVQINIDDTPEQVSEKLGDVFKPLEAVNVAWVHVFEGHDLEPDGNCELCIGDSDV